MKFKIQVKGSPRDIIEDLRSLKDMVDKVVEQNFAQIALMGAVDPDAPTYMIEASPINNGLVVVSTK